MKSLVLSTNRQGFTLLELCLVLFIIALMAGAVTPALHSALIEQSLRSDAGQFALLVRQGMLASADGQTPYLLQLDGKTLSLQPAPVASAKREPDTAPLDRVTLRHDMKFPAAAATNRWNAPRSASWRFDPDGLCPLPRLRVEEGAAYLEMSFNVLTGDVEDEALSLP